MTFVPRSAAAGVVLIAAALLPTSLAAETFTLARDEQSRGPIRVAEDASPRMLALAKELAGYLSRISGAEFRVTLRDEPAAVMLRVDRPRELAVFDRENYSIRTGTDGVLLSGTTEDAVEHAVWDLLHHLGYRQFFPGETWEVIPARTTLQVEVNLTAAPDYHFRRIWYGFGTWDYNAGPWQDWVRRNRMGGSLQLHSGHAYGGIIRARQQVFDQHPEFYALVDGQRQVKPQAKLCIGNPELRRTVVEYAVDHFRQHPDEDSISMDPSDGGGWCECELCRRVGTPSDRALLLANEVAQAVRPRFVGMYAYNYHSPPPTLRVAPNVCINVATAFIKGGRSLDDIISGWSRQGALLGIREYYSVSTWDRDLPGSARGSNLDYVAETIPDFHAKGARFLNAESSDNWGCNGLGYYLASRLLWDVDTATDRDAIVADFLNKAFGPAAEPMDRYYALIDGSNTRSRLVYEDLLARMYRLLESARSLVAEDSAERRRIDHLVLYTRYVDLFDRYRKATGAERQQRFEQMIRHVYRMRGTMMVHAKAIYRDVPARDRSIHVPDNAGWQVPEDRNPWKSSQPFAPGELNQFLEEGIGRYQPIELDFEPREYGERLVTVPDLNELEGSAGPVSRGRGSRAWYTLLQAPGPLELTITGGLIAHYRDRGNVKVRVSRIGGASSTGEQVTVIAEDSSVPPDGKARTVRFELDESGLYRIDLNDGMDLTQVEWPAGQPMAMKMSLEDHPRMLSGRWTGWFYVPHGTSRIGLYADTSAGSVLRPDGQSAQELAGISGQFISIPVPPDMDGTLWRVASVSGKVCFLNVPPWVARSPRELLFPEDAVQNRNER